MLILKEQAGIHGKLLSCGWIESSLEYSKYCQSVLFSRDGQKNQLNERAVIFFIS